MSKKNRSEVDGDLHEGQLIQLLDDEGNLREARVTWVSETSKSQAGASAPELSWSVRNDRPDGARLIDADGLKKDQWVEYFHNGAWCFYQVAKVSDTGRLRYDDVFERDFILCGVGEVAFDADEPVVVADEDPTGKVSPRRVVPDWDDYFLTIAEAVSVRAKCRRRQVGAVIVGADHRIMSTGYNGAPSGMIDCLQGGCPRGLTAAGSVAARSPYDDPTSPGYCTALHAEHNAVVYAGRDVHGATCYTTDAPCPGCTKTLAGAGVVRVVWPGGEGVPIEMLAARKVMED